MNKQSFPTVAIGWRFVAIAAMLLCATFALQAFAQVEETEGVNTTEEVIVSEETPTDIFISAVTLLEEESATTSELTETESATSSEVVSEEATSSTQESESTSESLVAAAVLSTDKDDYHPGETATIFGRFF